MKNKQFEIARRVMGSENAERFCEFFTSAVEKAAEIKKESKEYPVFIVTVTKRCSIMFSSYYDMLCWCVSHPSDDRPNVWKDYSQEKLSELAEVYKCCVITGDAALAMTYDIVETFATDWVFPQMVVVDELLYHGRSLNSFLYNFEKRIMNAKHAYSGTFEYQLDDEQFVDGILLASLNVMVLDKNIGKSVLLPRYEKKLRDSHTAKEISLTEVRHNSLAYTRYTSVCDNNTEELAMYVDKSVDCKDLDEFSKVVTNIQGMRQSNWISAYPDSTNTRVVCVIRRKESRIDESKYIYSPLMIIDHINPDKIMNLHTRIVKDAEAQGKFKLAALLSNGKNCGSNEVFLPWALDTINLVLSSWIFRKFLQKAAKIDGISYKESNIDQIASKFRPYDYMDLTSENTVEALKELLDFKPTSNIEDYLGMYTDESNHFRNNLPWCCNNPVEIEEKSLVVKCVEDALQEISFEAELNAYTLYGSGIYFSDEAMSNWGDIHSLDTVLQRIGKHANENEAEIGICEAIAILTHAMDVGLFSVRTVIDKHPADNRVEYQNSKIEAYTWFKIGEASMYIMPMRYSGLLDILSDVQTKRGEDFDGADFDIGIFIRKLSSNDEDIAISHDISMKPYELKKSMLDFYKIMVKNGQKFSEWKLDTVDNRQDFEKNKNNLSIDRDIRRNLFWAFRNI